MSEGDLPSSAQAIPHAQSLAKVLARYRDPSLPRSLTEIAITALPLIGLWAGMWALMHVSYWLSLILAVPAAGFLVRLFMIQHDCSHGAFFRHRWINDWVGRVIGVATLDALRLLEAHACGPSRQFRQPRPARHGRRLHRDGARISRDELARTAWLPPLSPSRRHVRPRAGLSLHPAAPRAARPDARRRLEPMDQHDGDQCRHRRNRRRCSPG